MTDTVAFQKNWPASFSLDSYKKHISEFTRWSEVSFEQQSVQSLVKARARFIDQLLHTLWQQHDLQHDDTLCLIAVGGYGRGELHPYSDIDLLILSQRALTPEQQDTLSAFVTQLWDLKLEVGHSVRTLDETIELGREDITIATNLMEMRRLLGNKDLYAQLQQAIAEDSFWSSQQFFEAKRHEQQQRHAQYHGTAYNLEPNLKANPGGLRDIQTVGWVAKRHFQTRTMRELVAYQYLTEDEYQELMECESYLWQMRFVLHLEAGRNENRILFDYQPAAAERLGFGDDGKASVERMMKRFFRTVQRVSELNEMLLQHFEGSILNNHQSAKVHALDDSFELHGHLIKAIDNSVFARRDNLIKLFWHIANNSNITGIHSDTLRLLRQVRRRLMGDLQDYEACRRLFLALMRHPRGMDTSITLMHKYGILAAYLPQWRNIVGQMQFDLFHAYTVDEHTHRLLKNLYRYTLPEHDNEFPLCSDIVRRMEKPELLFLAGIFHDIAKGRGGDHSELGAMDAREFCRLHKLSDFDSKLIAWLVEHHLLMSVTAQRKDIYDPQVVMEFAEQVRDETRLNYLYCLTLADIRATNDNLWNDWKGSLLRELYLSTQKAFRRGLEKPMDMRDQIRENQAEAMRLLLRQTFTKTEIQQLWSRIKADYFIRYNAKQIVWHCEHILRHKQPKEPLVLVSKAPIRGSTQVFVYTPDQPNLFARMVAALDSKKVDIFDAQIMTNKDGYAMDTFVILEQNGQPVSSPSRVQSIKRALEQHIQGKPEQRQHSRISRQMRQFNVPPKVSFMQGNSKNRTMVEIAALDAPGLLARIGDVFQQCSIQIHAAKITTLGERAEDFFMVSTAEDTALDIDQQSQLKRTLIEHLTQVTEG
ncbi:MAG: [protein-PII] uridylyltransferase [Alkalimonas sp.]|nr:[protein-PII] uridylyltransferase [Alkalimonas sp.]